MNSITKIKSLFKSIKPTIMLGRWNKKNDIQETISVFWTNTDHCGDTMCGNMLNNKKILNEIQKKDKKG